MTTTPPNIYLQHAGITYLHGDATRPAAGNRHALLVHCCNDIGLWGAGFVTAISARWPEPETKYRQWYESGDGFGLGAIQLVPVTGSITVVNLIGQHRVVGSTSDGQPPIRYQSLREGLKAVAGHAVDLDAIVHMPRIGAGLAGGDWSIIETLLIEELAMRDIDVYVYDLPQ